MSTIEERECSICHTHQPCQSYSRTQWKKGDSAKCKACVKAGQSTLPPQHNEEPSVQTEISLEPRPQKQIEGFENLTCCTDWPKTKSKRHPGAQSAVYTPLLACVIGPIPGHCTQEQLAVASQWWTAALPAWPRWIRELQEAGVDDPAYREKLLNSVKGQPNPLIYKTKGRGTVPHIQGKLQKEALERAPMVSIEVDACVQCMYYAE